jgi:hypothetical protein
MIIRRHHDRHFTIVPNSLFEDSRLSIEAKGTLAYLLSRPHNWTVRLGHVAKTLDVGRDKMQRIFNELIVARYVLRDQPRGNNQQWGVIEYVVFDEPVAPETKTPQPGFPCAAEPQPDFPCAKNTVAYKELKVQSTDSTKAADEPGAPGRAHSLIGAEAFALSTELLRLQGLGVDDPRAIATAYKAEEWLSKGWRRELIIRAVEIVMARRTVAPNGLRYFEDAIAEAHAEHDRPLPVAIGSSARAIRTEPAMAPSPTDWRGRRDDWHAACRELREGIAE